MYELAVKNQNTEDIQLEYAGKEVCIKWLNEVCISVKGSRT